MIKANELRVGNILENGVILEIKQTVVRLKYLYEGKEERTALNDYQQLEPIRLSEEWLKKLGFEKIFETDHRKVFDYYLDHRFGYNDNFGFRNINSAVTFVGNTFDHIEYVHQLQNLYFILTGKELELKK